ncbi:PREDICTED: ankyrin-1-like [Amphimedon queenslandica]|uniref:DED domain-containing protein n=1 Tax=Amphimedon queenslandica TaxID=400682 RepID=A0AAN0IC10_AMPQE|nr:PREDICTED: ankyrin-1-like [Amphimedon queenslandica]|eukprot:XP_003384716.1 PREDICTED: ankyrin-1-like [Amphimedon queenslandica]
MASYRDLYVKYLPGFKEALMLRRVRNSFAAYLYSERLLKEKDMDRIHQERETDETLAVLLIKKMEARVDSDFKCILNIMEKHEELRTILEGIKKDVSYNEDESSTTDETSIVKHHQLMVREKSKSPVIFSVIVDKLNSLQSDFRMLLMSSWDALDGMRINNFKMIVKDILQASLLNSQPYKESIDASSCVNDILNFLKDRHFIGYFNYGMLEELIRVFVKDKKHEIHAELESYKLEHTEFLKSTKFSDLFLVFENHPNLRPLTPVGLPKIILKLVNPSSQKTVGGWFQYMKDRFNFMDCISFSDVSVQCILVTLVVTCTYSYEKIWGVFHNPKIVSELLADGITILDCSDLERPIMIRRQKVYGAVAAGDIPHLLQLVRKGVDLNIKFLPHTLPLNNSQSLVHLAVDSGYHSMLCALIRLKVDVNIVNQDGKTALYYAIRNDRSDMVETLIQHGARVDEDGATHLHLLIENHEIDRMKALLSTGTDANVTNKLGDTPLHSAIKKGSLEAVETLLDHRVDTTIENKQGWTPLYTAAMVNAVDAFKCLLQSGCSLETGNKFGRNYLHYAAANGHSVAINVLINEGALPVDSTDTKDNKTPLHLAAETGHEETVRLLLNNEATIDIGDKDGRTPLHYASDNGHLTVVETLILEYGADVNAVDKEGYTPLHYASSYHLQVVEFLLEKGASPGSKGLDGCTPLHKAAWDGNNDIVKALLEKDVSIIDEKEKGGWAAINNAVMRGHHKVVETLIEYGADFGVNDEGEWSLLHIAARRGRAEVAEVLIDHKLDVNIKDKSGWRAFDVALTQAHPKVVETMLKHGASVNIRDSDEGKIALHIAVDSIQKPQRHEVVKLLLEHKGVDPNIPDDTGSTPLHYAVNRGYSKIVHLLLEYKADPYIKDENDLTPLDAAQDDEELMAIFKEFGYNQ